jgi:hypothetical protein
MGHTARETYCGIMNLPPTIQRFERFNVKICSAVEEVAKQSMEPAAKEAVEENEGNQDIPGALDSSWQKRGHTSHTKVRLRVKYWTSKS